MTRKGPPSPLPKFFPYSPFFFFFFPKSLFFVVWVGFFFFLRISHALLVLVRLWGWGFARDLSWLSCRCLLLSGLLSPSRSFYFCACLFHWEGPVIPTGRNKRWLFCRPRPSLIYGKGPLSACSSFLLFFFFFCGRWLIS